MKNSQELADRLEEVLLSGRWIANTNVKDQITTLSFEKAVHTQSGCNSIAALTFHLLYYLKGIEATLQGKELTLKDSESFTMPPISRPEEWQRLVQDFITTATKFVLLVSEMDDKKLDGPFVDPRYGTWCRNLEGIIEHSYYHLGQMVIFRKLIENTNE